MRARRFTLVGIVLGLCALALALILHSGKAPGRQKPHASRGEEAAPQNGDLMTSAPRLVLATALWFGVWSLRGEAPYPRWLGWFAVWIVALVVAFLVVPRILQPEYTFEMEYNLETPRPDVLLNSTFEWVVVLSAWIWIAALAIHDRPRQGEKP